MEIVRTIDKVKKLVSQARKAEKKIGLVPTMGALHIGHQSLIEAAASQSDYVIVTIFVNPTQFGPGEDFENYPRTLEADSEICRKAGADAIFAPASSEMYPRQQLTWVDTEEITKHLCGLKRPGHFRGVTTVCTKLFNISEADVAFFGQKDAQQATVIRRMVDDLNIPIEIVVCPTVRESSGLAISSRNQYLTETEREQAAILYKSLCLCRDMIASGQRDSNVVISEINTLVCTQPLVEPEYINIVDVDTLEDVDKITGSVLVAIAARVGKARLIDNMVVDLNNL